MNFSTLALLLVTVTVGSGIALQAVVNTALARTVGILEAAFVSVTVTWVIVAVVLIAGVRSGNLSQITSVSPYLFVGGFVGAAVLVTAVVAVPRLGAASLIAALVVGQLIGAMILDHFGLLGLQNTPITPIRLGGAMLLVIGMGLLLR